VRFGAAGGVTDAPWSLGALDALDTSGESMVFACSLTGTALSGRVFEPEDFFLFFFRAIP
jgi:hypothetical protein